MSEIEESSTCVSPMLFILFIVFIILKLTGVIDWSWWWVTSPIWIPLALVLAIAVLCIIFSGVLILLDIL